MTNDLAVVCQKLGIRAEHGYVVTDSLAVARHFVKRHDTVLRAIDDLQSHSTLLRSENWFRRTHYISDRGRSEPAYNMTRSGFALVAMGFTGADALAFKIQYIKTFDAMEAQLRHAATNAGAIETRDDLTEVMAMLREIQDRIPSRLDAAAIVAKLEEVKDRIAPVEATVHDIRQHQIERSRVRFSTDDRDVLRFTVHTQFHGRCPYSNEQILDANGDQLPDGSEYDHFNGPNNGGPQNGWLIAKRVHSAITRGELTRQELRPFFEVYQRRLGTIWKPKVISLNKRVQLKLL